MNTKRRAEDLQFQQLNQGEYRDLYKVKQVWNHPADVAAFDDTNKKCP
jgi:hypothetical protein